jgi:ADP-heptose:LPS heptosyltransferase
MSDPRELVADLLVGAVARVTSPRTTAAVASPFLWGRRVFGRGRRSRSERAPNILVIKLDAVGDVVLVSPFLRELRRTFPEGRISLLVETRVANLVSECPYVDEVLAFGLSSPIDRWFHPLMRRFKTASFALHRLVKERYDIAIVPRWGEDFYEAGTLAFLSGAPFRLGFSEHCSPAKECLNRDFDRFFTRVVDDRSVKHEVPRNLNLLSEVNGQPSDDRLEVWLSDDDRMFASGVMPRGSDAAVVLGPGAARAKRLWPIERFAEVARRLLERNVRIVVVGGPGEERFGAELREVLGNGVIDVVNATTLRQAAAIMRHCSLFCGNDAGPMHLAAAAGVPVVEISCHPSGGDDNHPNSPTRFGPWGVPHRIIRPRPQDGCIRGCEREVPHCILDIRIDSVISAIESLMEEPSPIEGRSDAC